MNIVDFIEARITEDERIAHEAASVDGEHWTEEDPFGGDSPDRVEGSGDTAVGYDMFEKVPPHIARHDPARVLRQCASLRQIVEDIQELVEDGEAPTLVHATTVWRLAPVAAIWSDHPDFREGWAI